jgi:hypothetical protein
MRSRRLRDRGSGLYQRVVRRRSVHGDALCQSCKVDVRSRSGVDIEIEMDRCCFVEDGNVWARPQLASFQLVQYRSGKTGGYLCIDICPC